MSRIAVIGAGAWGTALAKVLADAGNDVTLWARRQELADEINDTHRNREYLGDVELPNVVDQVPRQPLEDRGVKHACGGRRGRKALPAGRPRRGVRRTRAAPRSARRRGG